MGNGGNPLCHNTAGQKELVQKYLMTANCVTKIEKSFTLIKKEKK